MVAITVADRRPLLAYVQALTSPVHPMDFSVLCQVDGSYQVLIQGTPDAFLRKEGERLARKPDSYTLRAES